MKKEHRERESGRKKKKRRTDPAVAYSHYSNNHGIINERERMRQGKKSEKEKNREIETGCA